MSPPADAPRLGVDAPKLSLVPRPSISLEAPGAPTDFGVSPEQAEGLRAPDRPKDAQELVTNIAADAIGKAKVKRGLVHPYYSELGKALLKKWDAERAVTRNGLKGYGEQVVENSRTASRIWMEQAAAFGSSGNPLANAQDDLPREAVAVAPSIDPNLAARQQLRKKRRQDFRATRRATIRVIQDVTGKLLEAEIVSPSNDAKIDREALADVRAAAEQLPPPPPEALGGRAQIASLWQFELVISINPPVPSFSFEFDEALGYIDPRLPLDRRIYKRVRLLQVE